MSPRRRRPVACVWTDNRWSPGATAHDHRHCPDLLAANVGRRPADVVIASRRVWSLALSVDVETQCGEVALFDPADGWYCPIHGLEEVNLDAVLDLHTPAEDSTDPWVRATWLGALAVTATASGVDLGADGPALLAWLEDDSLGMHADGVSIHDAATMLLGLFGPRPGP